MDPRRTTPQDRARMHKLAAEGMCKAQIGRVVGYSRKTVIKRLKEPAPQVSRRRPPI